MTYKIVRFYLNNDIPNRVIRRGLTLGQALAHTNDPETSYSTCKKSLGKRRTKKCGPWFDGYTHEN